MTCRKDGKRRAENMGESVVVDAGGEDDAAIMTLWKGYKEISM